MWCGALHSQHCTADGTRHARAGPAALVIRQTEITGYSNQYLFAAATLTPIAGRLLPLSSRGPDPAGRRPRRRSASWALGDARHHHVPAA